MELSRIGAWLGPVSSRSAAETREFAPELEELGYGALWFAEGVGTKECFTQAATLLSWTERAVVATGIANIYARDPMATANGAKTLADAYPGRFLLGIGVSHAPSVATRGHEYAKPIATMRSYLDAMDAAAFRAAEPAEQPPCVLAALGPKMLELAAERTRGAHPYFTPPEHTAFAREVMGADAGSDRLVDAIVAWGDVDAVRGRVKAHLDAGADHVCVQAVGEDPLGELR